MPARAACWQSSKMFDTRQPVPLCMCFLDELCTLTLRQTFAVRCDARARCAPGKTQPNRLTNARRTTPRASIGSSWTRRTSRRSTGWREFVSLFGLRARRHNGSDVRRHVEECGNVRTRHKLNREHCAQMIGALFLTLHLWTWEPTTPSHVPRNPTGWVPCDLCLGALLFAPPLTCCSRHSVTRVGSASFSTCSTWPWQCSVELPDIQ